MFYVSSSNGEEKEEERWQFFLSRLSSQALPGTGTYTGPSLVTGIYIISTAGYALPPYLPAGFTSVQKGTMPECHLRGITSLSCPMFLGQTPGDLP